MVRHDYISMDDYDDMPLTKFFNLVQKEMVRKLDRNQRYHEALSEAKRAKNNDVLILFYLKEIMDMN